MAAGLHTRRDCSGTWNAVHDQVTVDHEGRRRDQPVSLRQLEFGPDPEVVFDHDHVRPARRKPPDGLPCLRAAHAVLAVKDLQEVGHIKQDMTLRRG